MSVRENVGACACVCTCAQRKDLLISIITCFVAVSFSVAAKTNCGLRKGYHNISVCIDDGEVKVDGVCVCIPRARVWCALVHFDWSCASARAQAGFRIHGARVNVRVEGSGFRARTD